MTFKGDTVSCLDFRPCLVNPCLQFGGDGKIIVFNGNEGVSLLPASSDDNLFALVCQVEHMRLLAPKFS